MTEEVLQLLSDDPMVVLNRGYRAKERIAARQKRIEEWRQIAESITANPENASSGGGYPTSKTENCVVAIMTLQEEIKDEIMEIADFERQTSQIIKELVEDLNFKTVLELRYLSYLLSRLIVAASSIRNGALPRSTPLPMPKAITSFGRRLPGLTP